MTKKQKIKKWFKDHFTKKNIINWLFVGLIALIVILCVYFENKDKETMNNKENNIIIVNDNISLNKNYHLDNDGNIVSENLLNPSYILLQYTTTDSGIPTTPSANNRAVTNYLPISPNTTYTISCLNSLFIREINYASSVGDGLGANVVNATNYTFITPNNANYLILLFGIGNQPDTYAITLDDIKNNCMLNIGSTALAYEPFGIWYSNEAYDNILTMASYAQLISNAYTNLKTINEIGTHVYRGVNYVDTAINFPEEYNNVQFYRLMFNSDIKIYSGYIFSIVTFGYDYTIQFYNLDTLVYSLTTSVLTSEDNYRSFYTFNETFTFNNIRINNDGTDFTEDSPLINLVSTNSGYQLSQQYEKGYQEGFNNGSIVSDSVSYQNGYNTGYQVGLNEGANSNFETNGFTALLNAIFSYPVNFISRVFNFEFMGINVASILLFLVSVGIVLFVVKRLWK